MVDSRAIEQCLKKSSELLLQNQEENGSWTKVAEHAGHKIYQYPLILTSQAVQSLILTLDLSYIKTIRKGLAYCLNSDFDDKTEIDISSWAVSTLLFSNTQAYLNKAKQGVGFLLHRQNAQGYWPRYPKTNILTNFSALRAVKEYLPEDKATIFKEWLIKNKASDGIGWGFDATEQTESRFTSYGILSFLMCGASPGDENIQKAREFIKQNQDENGCWRLPETLDIVHRTSLSTLVLMLTSENPFNKNVEKAVEFLISTQKEDGSYKYWSIHSIYFTHLLFSFYLYLKQRWNSEALVNLRKQLTHPQTMTLYLFRQFEQGIKVNLQLAIYKSVLSSHVLGTTNRAVERRQDILRVLDTQGAKTTAELIDSLKEKGEYKHLRKKSHLTQIKSDVEFLRSLNLIDEDHRKYYSSFRVV